METVILSLSDAEKTRFAGQSLAKSWYRSPVLYLTGPVGAGKTTFLQGLGEAFGLPEPVLSPTFALAHPHPGRDGSTYVTHIDLYRLDEDGARDFMRKLQWEGGLWVEWADRLSRADWMDRHVHLHLTEDGVGRSVKATFTDVPLPSSAQIADWRERVGTPPNVIAHCETVALIAEKTARLLLARGVFARPELARVGGQVHDMLRFVDFLASAAPTTAPEWDARWKPWKEKYAGLRHEAAVAEFLKSEGFPELAEVVRTHGILPPPTVQPLTIEQQVVFYADKRAISNRVVTVKERFDDFAVRYAGSGQTSAWELQALELERELFPAGAPPTTAFTTPTV